MYPAADTDLKIAKGDLRRARRAALKFIRASLNPAGEIIDRVVSEAEVEPETAQNAVLQLMHDGKVALDSRYRLVLA